MFRRMIKKKQVEIRQEVNHGKRRNETHDEGHAEGLGQV